MTKHFRVYLSLSFFFFCIGSTMLLVIPAVSTSDSAFNKIGVYIPAVIFWLSIVLGFYFIFRCSKERQWLEDKLYRSRHLKYSMPGVVSFFKNYEAAVADILVFISAITISVILRIRAENEWIVISFVFLFCLSFNLHCLFNGKNYRYYKALKNKSREEKNHHA